MNFLTLISELLHRFWTRKWNEYLDYSIFRMMPQIYLSVFAIFVWFVLIDLRTEFLVISLWTIYFFRKWVSFCSAYCTSHTPFSIRLQGCENSTSIDKVSFLASEIQWGNRSQIIIRSSSIFFDDALYTNIFIWKSFSFGLNFSCTSASIFRISFSLQMDFYIIYIYTYNFMTFSRRNVLIFSDFEVTPN